MGKLTGGPATFQCSLGKCLQPQHQHKMVVSGPHGTDSCPLANFWAEEGPSRRAVGSRLT